MIQSPFRLCTLEIDLTFEGLKNYKKVIAIVFEYFRIVREEWLADGKQLLFFKEMQTISNLSWEVFQE